MADTFVSTGAAFSGGFNDYLMKQKQQEHQDLLDNLAQKREERMAQAELDSASERRDEIARKQAKDKADIHEKAVADFKKNSIDTKIKGDRPTADEMQQANNLGLAGVFQQSAPAMSTAVAPPPAALAANPAPDATAAGATADASGVVSGGLPTPAGAMAPGPMVYPGSPKERLAEQDETKRKAFIQNLRDQGLGDRADELANAYEAESVGLKTPPGYFSKSAASSKHRVIFDPITKTYIDGVTHKPITDESDLENAQVDRSAEPKDNSAAEDRRAARFDRLREHAYAEFKDASKPLMDRIDRADKLETSLNQHTDAADSTIAEQLVTLTAGGAGSGVRISQPMIDQVLSKSRTRWDDFSQALKRWDASPKDPKNIGLFFTAGQRQAISDLGKAYREAAVAHKKKILDYRRQIDEAPDDAYTINHIRSRAQDDTLEAPSTPAPAAGPKKSAEQILKDAGL